MLDQNKKINIIFGILLGLLILNVVQMPWAFGISSAKNQKAETISAKSSPSKGYSFGKPIRRPAREIPPPEQGSILRQPGQYFGSTYSEIVQVCKGKVPFFGPNSFK